MGAAQQHCEKADPQKPEPHRTPEKAEGSVMDGKKRDESESKRAQEPGRTPGYAEG